MEERKGGELGEQTGEERGAEGKQGKKKIKKEGRNKKGRGKYWSIRNQTGQRITVIPGYLVVDPLLVFNGFFVRTFGDELTRSPTELRVMIAYALRRR